MEHYDDRRSYLLALYPYLGQGIERSSAVVSEEPDRKAGIHRSPATPRSALGVLRNHFDSVEAIFDLN